MTEFQLSLKFYCLMTGLSSNMIQITTLMNSQKYLKNK